MNKVNFQNRFIIDRGANIQILKEKYFKFIDFQDFKNSYNQALDYLKELTDVAKKYKDVMEFDKYIRLETEMETRN